MKEYIIVDLYTQEVYRDADGMTLIFRSFEQAAQACGINELDNVWICELIHNYKEQ